MVRSPSAHRARKSPALVNIFIAAIFPCSATESPNSHKKVPPWPRCWCGDRVKSITAARGVPLWEHDAAKPAPSGLGASVYCCGGRWTLRCSHHLLPETRKRGWMAPNAERRQGQWCSGAVSPPGCCGMERIIQICSVWSGSCGHFSCVNEIPAMR